MSGLRPRDQHLLVNRYIGVNGGYLGEFTYRTHREFYLELDLDIDPDAYPGTTRARFIQIVNESPPHVQATIIRGILKKYPEDPERGRTRELREDLSALADRLAGEGAPPVRAPVLATPSSTVLRALRDAEVLIESTGPSSAVDRVHTAVHGYLLTLCRLTGIATTRTDSAQRLLVLLIEQHPALAEMGVRADETKRLLRGMVSVIDALGGTRNNATLAHPNDELLGEAEARLAVDAAYAVLTYLEARTALRG